MLFSNFVVIGAIIAMGFQSQKAEKNRGKPKSALVDKVIIQELYCQALFRLGKVRRGEKRFIYEFVNGNLTNTQFIKFILSCLSTSMTI